MHTRARFASTLVIVTALLSASTVFAQGSDENATSFQVERFEPMPAQGVNHLNVASSDVVPHSQPTTGLFIHYVDQPLVQRDLEGEEEVVARLIDNQLKAEVWAGIGLHEMFDIGFVLPIVITQTGEQLTLFNDPEQAVSGAALADLRIVPKARLVDPDDLYGVGVALLPTLLLPTGDRNSFNSDGSLKFEPRLAIDWRHELGFTAAGNLAYLFRPEQAAENYVSDDVIRWAFGGYAPFPPIENFGFVGSIFGDIQLAQNRNPEDISERVRDGKGSPVEFDLGAQYDLPHNLVANLGAGTGITNGVGAPRFRVFASIGYTPRMVDSDGDGLYDHEDECPYDPEDFDGFEDSDGCPDHDNDQDGILDVDDECPDEPEDFDGFEDSDGCPDPDNDGDGVLDVDDECPDTPGPPERNGCPVGDRDGDGIPDDEDACPDDPEDFDGFEDEDGCPDLDNDEDGIPDSEDQCPDDPEDFDGFEDEDGCPDPDNDGDGVPDVDDKCPLQPGLPELDGCPKDTKVRVTETKIEILEKVYFDTAKATIKSRSFGLLDEIANVLKQNKQITKLRIEGHTDSRGSASYNQDLSERRAASVKEYLVEKAGIDAGRLVSEGYGESQPIADNSKKAGRDQNRRVEFTILELNGKPLGSKTAIIRTEEEVDVSEEDGADQSEPAKEAPAESKPDESDAEGDSGDSGDSGESESDSSSSESSTRKPKGDGSSW